MRSPLALGMSTCAPPRATPRRGLSGWMRSPKCSTAATRPPGGPEEGRCETPLEIKSGAPDRRAMRPASRCARGRGEGAACLPSAHKTEELSSAGSRGALRPAAERWSWREAAVRRRRGWDVEATPSAYVVDAVRPAVGGDRLSRRLRPGPSTVVSRIRVIAFAVGRLRAGAGGCRRVPAGEVPRGPAMRGTKIRRRKHLADRGRKSPEGTGGSGGERPRPSGTVAACRISVSPLDTPITSFKRVSPATSTASGVLL